MAMVFVRAAALALLLALLPWRALAAEPGDYAPENILKTNARMGWICMVYCPVSADVRSVVARAIANDRSAQYLLGLTLLTGDGLPRDRAAGMIWVVKAAEQGEPSAARDVARRLRNGEGIKVDETKVADALKPAAQAGEVEAMRALGPMIIGGRGTKQDPVAGLAMIKAAADKGSSAAEQDLSQLYLNGAPGITPNRPEAMRWLAASARHGNVDAMLNLGYMSIGASSNERNVAEGYCWLMRAALLDNVQAHEKLSTIFASGEKDSRGTVIAVDLVQADYWFRLAARSLYHDNSQIRAMIEPKMTTAQIDDAKRLVEAWRPRKVDELKSIAIPLPGTTRSCPAFG
ncbi:MAG: tetratricopeptide repeat protein [Pseudolabrys sp.]